MNRPDSVMLNELWDGFDSGQPVLIKVDMLRCENDSDTVTKLQMMEKLVAIEITRDAGSLDLSGDLIFESFTMEDYAEYRGCIQIDPEKNEKFRLSVISGNRDICLQCIDAEHSDSEIPEINDRVHVDFKNITQTIFRRSEESVTEYYLNVPDTYPDETKRVTYDVSLKINGHFGSEPEKSEIPDVFYAEFESHTFDINGRKIEIRRCENITDWDGAIAIKYDWAADWNFRKMFTDYVSFLLGRRMIMISEKIEGSEFTTITNHSFYESTAYLKQRDTPPLDYKFEQNGFNNLLETHFCNFEDIYQKYCISHFLKLYWHAATQPKDVAITLYHLAVEVLTTAFKSIRNEEYYITEDEMNALCGDELQTIRSKLKTNYPDQWEPISEAIKNAIIKSQSKLLKEFSKSLGIKIGKREKRIFEHANSIRHGADLPQEDVEEIHDFYVEYCNTVILKLIHIDPISYGVTDNMNVTIP